MGKDWFGYAFVPLEPACKRAVAPRIYPIDTYEHAAIRITT